jgi:transcriptional regulator with XRE-family HTH domain
MTEKKMLSEYEKREATTEGRLSLAAARLALRVQEVLESAKRRSGKTSREIAAQLDVTEGRVSQILNGDGNLHVATIARFLGACGLELKVMTVPFGAATSPNRRERRDPSAPQNRGTWHLYAQNYMTSSGVTRTVDFVTADGNDMPIPLGEPVHMGRLERRGTSIRVEPSDEAAAWQQKTKNALEHEGVAPVRVPV